MNADSSSSVSIGGGTGTNNEYINATGDNVTINESNATIYVFDAAYNVGSNLSSDTFSGSGSGDTIKFVTQLIASSAAFVSGSPAAITPTEGSPETLSYLVAHNP